MSTEIAESSGVAVTRYAGPVAEDSRTRARVQITNQFTGEYVTFSYEQWETLRFIVNTVDVWRGLTIRA